MSGGDPIRQRIEQAMRILRESGFQDVTVDAEGHEREIAAVRVPPADFDRLAGPDGARVADEMKAAGFRYVALDLLPSDASADRPADSSIASSGIPSDTSADHAAESSAEASAAEAERTSGDESSDAPDDGSVGDSPRAEA